MRNRIKDTRKDRLAGKIYLEVRVRHQYIISDYKEDSDI